MNGTGSEEEGVKMEDTNKTVVLMLGYLPGALQDRSTLLSRETIQFPATNIAGDSWKDVCGGGCGFAMAISVQKLMHNSKQPKHNKQRKERQRDVAPGTRPKRIY